MKSLWRRIESALMPVTPGAIAALQAGAPERTINDLEATLGGALPHDLKESLLIHDGQRPPYMSSVLFNNEYLLPCEQIASTWSMRNRVADDLRGDESEPGSTARWWDSVYIPVTESDGNGFCVHRTSGAVYYHVHDGNMVGPMYSCWKEFLFALLSKIEQGQFTVEIESAWVELERA